MNRSHLPSWIRQVLLLSALGAGALTTLLVPPYQEVALVPDDEKPVSSSESQSGTNGMTGVDVDLRHLTRIGNTS